MYYVKKHPLFTIFTLAIFIRFLLLFIDFSFDVNNHIAWAKDLWQVGFTNFYLTPSTEVYASLYPNYPPLAMYIFYAMYPFHKILYDVLWWLNLNIPIFPSKLIFIVQDRHFIAATFKIPSVAADMGIALMCYIFTKKLIKKESKSNKMLLMIPALVLLNPAIFYNSSFWGQIDSIPIFFVLISVYLLLYSKRHIISGLFFVGALLVKPTALVFLPIYGILFVWKFGVRDSLKAFVIGNVFFIVSFIPFLGKMSNIFSPYVLYFQNILQAQSLAFVTNSAFNLWSFTGVERIRDTNIFMFGLSYKLWGYVLVGIMMMAIVKLLFKTRDGLYALFLSSFAFFLFATKMHERYTLLLLPFLLLALVNHKSLLKWYVILSIVSFLNLYYSWPVPHSEILENLLHTPIIYLSLSASLMLIFFYLLSGLSISKKDWS